MRLRVPAGGDAGSAVVEFLGATLVLLVPLVYLVLVLGQLQAAAFAVDGAAREAARVLATTADADDGMQRASTALALALDDQGLDPALADGALSVTCPGGCPAGSTLVVDVEVQLPLTGVPRSLTERVTLTIPVVGSAVTTVDPFAER